MTGPGTPDVAGTVTGPTPAGPDRADVEQVLRQPERLVTWFQPIVDTATGGAAGWEALSRFHEPDGSRSRWGPQEWFATAQGSELGSELEALALRHALAAVDRLPPNTFLTMNVSPAAITSEPVRAALAGRPDLSRVIVEVTETEAVDDVAAVSSVCAGVRAAGGLVAVDDAGSGYAGLSLIAHLRPQLVKVDRELVQGCHADPVKLSLVEVLGVWAAGMDAWLLAEGVETADEYAAVVALGVPLVQGWYTGRPGPEPVGPGDHVVTELRSQRHRVQLRDAVASLMRDWPPVPETPDAPGAAEPPHVVVDPDGRPLSLVQADPATAPGARRVTPVSLRVRPSETVTEALHRAMGREPATRYDPVVVVDPRGRVVGVVPVDALVTRVLSDR